MIIQGGKLFQADGTFCEGDLAIRDGLIAADATPAAGEQVIDARGLTVIPGLTDIHFHGCMGTDFCAGSPEGLQRMADYELSQGVTQICPASMTVSEEELAAAFATAAAHTSERGAELVGINMEGPFINKEKKGAQNPAHIHVPDAAMFRRLQEAAGGLVKLVDIAPETEGALEFIHELAGEVRISLAHTTASYDEARAAFDAGARHVTHLWNAMPPFTHRAPGVVGAAAEDSRVMAELICDGIHIHASAVRATFAMFSDDRICFISDSMEATGLEDGKYGLGGLEVFVKGRRATLADGTIAGSATNLMGCLRCAVTEMGIPLGSAVKCAAVNPARAIGIFGEYGSLDAGKAGNVVLLDESLQVVHVIRRGEVVA